MQKRLDGVDGLRGVAVILVVLLHAFGAEFLGGGFYGVDLFFVISGFVITNKLLQEHANYGKIAIFNFYLSRVFRLWPAFLVLLGYCIFTFDRPILKQATVAFFGMMNWVKALGFDQGGGGALAHTWSLSAEEQFYLIWPTLFAFMAARGRTFIVVCILVLIFFFTLERITLALLGAAVDRLYYGLDTHSDALLFGCLLSVIRIKSGFRWDCAPLEILAFMTFVLMAVFSNIESLHVYVWGLTLIAVSSTILTNAAANSGTVTEKVMSLSIFVWLGQRSYSLYLWHYPILVAIKRTRFFEEIRGNEDSWSRAVSLILLAVGILVAVLISHLSYSYIERPFISVGRRIVSRNVGEASTGLRRER